MGVAKTCFNAFSGILSDCLAQLFVRAEPANRCCQCYCITSRENQAAMLQGRISKPCIDAKQLNNNLNQVLVSLDSLLKNYSDGGLSKTEIKETVDAMQDTMRNLQPVLQKLNQSPNSLIFTDSNSSDIEPKAKR